MKVCAVTLAVLASGNALALNPLMAVLLIAGGFLLAAAACVAIVGVVRLAGRRPAQLLDRDGGGHARHPGR